MKLFLDTSNKHLILALLNLRNEVYDFVMLKSNNDMVKNSIDQIDKFLVKNNVTLDQIDTFFTTTGPGSFTGVKVGINFISSIALTKKNIRVFTTDTFRLIENGDYSHTIIPFGKSKYYVKAKNSKKIVVMNEEEIKELPSPNEGYKKLNKNLLQQKIINKAFKIRDNLNKIEVKYLSDF